MSLYDDDYKVELYFSQQYPHGVDNDEWRMKDGTLLLRNRTGTTPATANTKAICSIKAEDVDGK